MLGKEMLLQSSGKSGPLTENNLIVRSSRGSGYTTGKTVNAKKFAIYMGKDIGDQVFSVQFPVIIAYNRTWEPKVQAISNANIDINPGNFDYYVFVIPIDPSKPVIIDVYNYH